MACLLQIPLLLLSLLTATGGCRAPSGRLRASVLDPFSSAVPDLRSPVGRLWFAERTHPLSAYAIELQETLSLQLQPRRTVRFLVLRGRVRVRLGPREATLDPGSLMSVPRRTAYRILPLGKPAPRLLMFLMPDGHDAMGIETPVIARRISARPAP